MINCSFFPLSCLFSFWITHSTDKTSVEHRWCWQSLKLNEPSMGCIECSGEDNSIDIQSDAIGRLRADFQKYSIEYISTVVLHVIAAA